MWHPIVVALLICAGASSTYARFQQLAEVCRTTSGLGVCVQSDLCCTAVGGTIYNDTNGLIQPAIARSLNVQADKVERSSRRYTSLNARASELEAFPESLQERSVNQTSGCSYSGVCCVLPTPTDYDCSSCGLWGDGVRRKVTTPPPVEVPPTTTPATNTPKKIQPRIVGGTDAPRNRWCWQVAILDANGLVCGGALIARNWVITAAHCVAGRFLDELIVALGLYDFVHSDADSIVYYHTPVGAILNNQYNPATYDADLALIRIPDAPCGQPGICTICLGPPLTFVPPTTTSSSTTASSTTPTGGDTSTYTYGAAFVNPLQPTFDPKATLSKIQNQITSAGGSLVVDAGGGIVSAGTTNPYANLVCAITGFGSTGVTPVAPVLQQAYQQIISPDQCESDYERLGVPAEKINLPANTICSRGLTLTESSCVGDGGGPLACQSHADHGWYLYGVIGLGSNMCMPGAENGPTISAAVGSYLSWILSTVHDLPAADLGSGRNAYKVPGCGSDVLANNPNATDPALGGCPINVHQQQAAALAAASAPQRRSLIATSGQLYDFKITVS